MDFDEPMEAENLEEEPVKVKAEPETKPIAKVEPKTEPQDKMLMYVCRLIYCHKVWIILAMDDKSFHFLII